MPAIRNMFAFLKQMMESGNFDYFMSANQNGLGIMKTAKMTYDFTVDGGAIANNIIPTNSPLLPDDAVIVGGVVEITAACVGGSISLGTSAGSSNVSLKAATAAATYALNTQIALIPVWTAASSLKLTAPGRLNLSITSAPITAGKFAVQVTYFQGNA